DVHDLVAIDDGFVRDVTGDGEVDLVPELHVGGIRDGLFSPGNGVLRVDVNVVDPGVLVIRVRQRHGNQERGRGRHTGRVVRFRHQVQAHRQTGETRGPGSVGGLLLRGPRGVPGTGDGVRRVGRGEHAGKVVRRVPAGVGGQVNGIDLLDGELDTGQRCQAGGIHRRAVVRQARRGDGTFELVDRDGTGLVPTH